MVSGAVELSDVSKRWGIELSGAEADLKVWRVQLKPPFDPFVEEVKDEHGDYLVLRSSAFKGIATSQEVHRTAKQLSSTLNATMSRNADTDPVTNGLVIEFVPNGQPRRHRHIKAEGGRMRLRGGIAEMTVKDAQSNLNEPPPAPSRAQRWIHAAALEPEIGCALRYLEDKPNWIDLYKAFEAVRDMPNGGILECEKERFTQTANVGNRHHPNDRHRPHECPMELSEARALMMQWVSAAIDHTLAESL